MSITIYHNPACGTSRNTLAILKQSGAHVRVIEYLVTPPDRETLVSLIAAMGGGVRAALRTNVPPFADLGLAETGLGDEALIDAMMAHPIFDQSPHRGQPQRHEVVPPLRSRARFAR
jgi:arsenate reductase (glutaredoxin)